MKKNILLIACTLSLSACSGQKANKDFDLFLANFTVFTFPLNPIAFLVDREANLISKNISETNNTAFEWRDIMYNNEGISRWRSYRGKIDPVDAARQINSVNGVHMAPWNDFGTK